MHLFRKVLPAVVTALVLLLVSAPASANAKKSRKARAAERIFWKVTETATAPATATWTWDKKRKRFLGRWSNGATGHLRVEKVEKQQIVLTRTDHKGTRAGLTARYEGTITGNKVAGTVTYTYTGQVTRGTWQATHFGGKGTTARKRPLNKKRYRSERKVLLSNKERRSFPRLGANFEVLAPRTKVYNCIAWSIGVTNRWVWPGPTLSAFDQLYGMYGYKRLPTKDYHVEPGVQKIVLYARVFKNGRIKCTHGARQLSDGTWTSKLGKLPLIRHKTPEALNGPSYGRPIAVYVKS
jgi:hypothetical protein